MQNTIMQKIIEFDEIIAGMESKIKNIQNELIQYKNLTENQSSILSNIMEMLKVREDIVTTTQKGFLANIFKKK
jgi:conjugal transfer/entry exclusion protein